MNNVESFDFGDISSEMTNMLHAATVGHEDIDGDRFNVIDKRTLLELIDKRFGDNFTVYI